MTYIVPEIEGKIEKITIFPPIKAIKIIDIHRLMMDDRIVPATIMQAGTQEMKLKRDISLTLAAIYISCDERVKYIAEYFKVSETEVSEIIERTIINKHKELLSYQEILKKAFALKIAWDVEKDCQLSFQRAEEIRRYAMHNSRKYQWFSPSLMRYKKEV